MRTDHAACGRTPTRSPLPVPPGIGAGRLVGGVAFRSAGGRTLAPPGFVNRDRAWHHTTPVRELYFCPEDTKFGVGFAVNVHHGGPHRWILADREAHPDLNRQALLHNPADDGITDLSARATHAAVEASGAVADDGLDWAEHTTVARTAALLERHARALAGSPVEGWLTSYRPAAGR